MKSKLGWVGGDEITFNPTSLSFVNIFSLLFLMTSYI